MIPESRVTVREVEGDPVDVKPSLNPGTVAWVKSMVEVEELTSRANSIGS